MRSFPSYVSPFVFAAILVPAAAISGLACTDRWSPTGDRIAYDRNGDIYTMNADGSNQVNVINELTPSVSSDGKKIAFFAEGATGNDVISVMNADGTSPVALTNGTFDDRDPAFGPKR
jgi:Tol biopolymer transport system component